MTKLNAANQAQMVKLLLEGTRSCAELAEQTGLHYVTVLHYTRELHRSGAAHISMWKKDARGRDKIRLYKLGPGPDASRQTMTEAERQRRHRERKKELA